MCARIFCSVLPLNCLLIKVPATRDRRAQGEGVTRLRRRTRTGSRDHLCWRVRLLAREYPRIDGNWTSVALHILPENIVYGGAPFRLWLTMIFNTLLECNPACLNNAIIVPMYKGKGKNPLLTNSYRGISLTSVIGKLFECIVLQRITPILAENGIPHHT